MEEIAIILSDLFQNDAPIRALFISAGLKPSKLPVLNFPTTPYAYWEKVISLLSEEEVKILLSRAYERYPGNKTLKRLAGE